MTKKLPPKPAADRGLEALSDLIVEMARSDLRSRFVEIKRLAEIGHGLMLATSRRLEDFKRPGPGYQAIGNPMWNQMPVMGGGVVMGGGGYDGDGGDVGDAGGVQIGGGGVVMPYTGPLDQNALTRQALLLLGPHVQVATEKARADIAEAEMREVNEIDRALAGKTSKAKKTTLTERRDELMTNIATRAKKKKETIDATRRNGTNGANGNGAHAHHGAHVVPADLPRRYPALRPQRGRRRGDGIARV